jgi:predicted HicB family RNase H-like nuclease
MVTVKNNLEKQIEYYMNLPYTMTIKHRSEQRGYYVAGYIELPDLTMTGNSPEEAVRELLNERRDWFKTCLSLGIKIPLPVDSPRYSGEIRVRMPPSLHQTLAQRAASEGVSLNQYMVTGLARAVGLEK